jgi:hypothetical protein
LQRNISVTICSKKRLINKSHFMNKHLLCCCTFLLVANLSFGQRDRSPKEGQFPRKPGLILTTSVLSLFEPEGGPTMGLECRFGLHWAIAADVTALLYTMPELYHDDERHTGYRIQPQIKYYLPGRRHSYQMYISLMGLYKSVHYYTVADDYSYYDGNQYIQVEGQRYREHKEIIAGSANFGFQKFLDEERHFMIEFYGGVGLRSKQRTGKPPIPNTTTDNYDYYDNDGLDDGIWPHVSYGIKFGYRF